MLLHDLAQYQLVTINMKWNADFVLNIGVFLEFRKKMHFNCVSFCQIFELSRKSSSDTLCWASPVWVGCTAAAADTAHPGIGDLGSVTKIIPWEHNRVALIPFLLRKSVLAKRREQELLEVLVAMVRQLMPLLGLSGVVLRLLHTGGRMRDTVCALDLGMGWLILCLFVCVFFGFMSFLGCFFVCVLISFVKSSRCILGPMQLTGKNPELCCALKDNLHVFSNYTWFELKCMVFSIQNI